MIKLSCREFMPFKNSTSPIQISEYRNQLAHNSYAKFIIKTWQKQRQNTTQKTQWVEIYYELSPANPFRQIKLEHQKPMDVKKIVVIVEDVDAARAALLWALQNLLRFGDVVTLLHVFPSLNSRNRKKLRLLRLKGYQLALSFKDICNDFFNVSFSSVTVRRATV